LRWFRNNVRRVRHIFRAVRGKDLYFRVQVRCESACLGNERAEWCICPDGLSNQSVVYSFGVGEDISFDLELIRRFGAQVHAFDPTPRSIAWVQLQTLPAQFNFHEYGIGAVDGNLMFRPPENPRFVSYRVASQKTMASSIEAPVHRLATIMKMLGHDEVDVLKMDIEGAEYDVLGDVIASKARVGQLLVEFHHRWEDIGLEKTRDTIRKLNRAGFRIFKVSPTGEEYSFLRT
jgi:FkbM family methyltransferase